MFLHGRALSGALNGVEARRVIPRWDLETLPLVDDVEVADLGIRGLDGRETDAMAGGDS